MCQYKCKWLPEINPCEDLSNYCEYEKELYKTFKKMFFEDKIEFNGLPIRVKKSPKWGEYESAFIHLTCETNSPKPSDVNDRDPDFRRAERLHWIKPVIENYPCRYNCDNCEGILMYEECYKGNVNIVRTKLFFPKFNYIVILEKRSAYYELITAFYINPGFQNKNINKHYEKYNEYIRQGTPLI